MYRLFNFMSIAVSFLFAGTVMANEGAVDGRAFSAWCPTSLSICRQDSTQHDTDVAFSDLVSSAEYAMIASPSAASSVVFSELMSAYHALTLGKSVPDLSRYVHGLQRDISERKQLYRYAIKGKNREDSAVFHHPELRHYYKELRYLKSLQLINYEQRKILKAASINEKSMLTLSDKVYLQEQQLAEAVHTIVNQLTQDIEMEMQVLRYFVSERADE